VPAFSFPKYLRAGWQLSWRFWQSWEWACLATPSAQAQSYLPQTLHSFTGADGQNPGYGHLIADASGNLYGTTTSGGTNGAGVVFELVKSGATYTETVLHSFMTSGSDGQHPSFGLIMDSSGNLYGTTVGGGAYGKGTVFELAAPLTAGMSDIVIYSFPGFPPCPYLNCEANPTSGLIMDSSGNLYGTTLSTVFELAAPLTAGMNDIVLHVFSSTQSSGDGFEPSSGVIMDSSGNLYGTTLFGGANSEGTVFELPAPLSPFMSDVLLHSFNPSPGDGYHPQAGVIIDSRGNLYGTTVDGGANGFGAVFELAAPLSAGMTDVILHSFSTTAFSTTADGANPDAALIMDGSGNLFGTTSGFNAGVGFGGGTVFELVNNSGIYTERILRDFILGCGPDGTHPLAGLTLDSSGNLYGTTSQGSANNAGTVFELTLYSGPAYATSTSVASSLNPATAGSSVALTATVTSSLGYVPPGTVTFSNGALVVGSAPTSCGVALLQLAEADTIGVGTVTLTAQYTPDSAAVASSSSTYNQTVNEPGAVLTSGNNNLTGNQTVNGTVTTAGAGSGFFGNGSGLSNLNPASLSAGTAGINITGNAATAMTSTSATTAANATALGGVAAAHYARLDMANSFNGNQTVTGGLTVSAEIKGASLAIGGGTAVTEYVSITQSVTLPALSSASNSDAVISSCATFTTPALTGFTPGASDTITVGVPKTLLTGLGTGVFLDYQAWENSSTASPSITIQVCNPSGSRYKGGASGLVRVDITKH
jgi:uncharacterized repeat protein (TIGR03803 family)